MNIELSQVMKENGRMATWAERVCKNIAMSEEDRGISEAVDAFAKRIGETGVADVALSQYLIKTITPEVYNAPSELLSLILDSSEIGEFDEVGVISNPVNRLMARNSAPRTGEVDKSYIDFTRGTKESVHLQVNTELKMSDLRQNGFKTIAQLQQFATESLNNAKFYNIFNKINTLLGTVATPNVILATDLTVLAMDEFTGYTVDRGRNPLVVGLTEDLRKIKNMSGYTNFLSNEMKGALNANAIMEVYGGATIAKISSAEKLADGTKLLPAKTLFGISDKVGSMYMRGGLRVLQTPDNSKEIINLKFTGFEFVYAITQLDKIAKLIMTN